MGNILLIGVIAFFVIMTAIGYHRGMIKTIFSLLSVIVVLVVVVILTPTVRLVIKETPLYPYIMEKTQEFVDDNIERAIPGVTEDQNPIAGLGLGEQTNFINELPIPQNLKDTLISNNTEAGYKGLEVTNFSDYIVISITNIIVNSIAFIILFVVIVVAIRTAVMLLDIISKLPILNFLNKSGGAVCGLLEALLVVWIVCIIVTAFGTMEWARIVLEEIDNNVFLSFIYSNNILERVLTDWLV